MKVPEMKAEYLALKRTYRTILGNPSAQPILDDLDRRFNGSTLRQVDKVFDVHASMAAAGAREVLLHIDKMMREKDATTN